MSAVQPSLSSLDGTDGLGAVPSVLEKSRKGRLTSLVTTVCALQLCTNWRNVLHTMLAMRLVLKQPSEEGKGEEYNEFVNVFITSKLPQTILSHTFFYRDFSQRPFFALP